MFAYSLFLLLLLQEPSSSTGPPPTQAVADADSDAGALLKVKRIYVDSFGDDAVSKNLQSMFVASLVATKRFKVTENRDKADAILKGVASENTSQELHAYGEGTAVGSGSRGTHAGISDSSVNTETVNSARLAVRLVNSVGDVIWTSAQESRGAKYKGSSADVVDRCMKQLLRDVAKLESTELPPPKSSVPTTSKK
jgi:hypothetical protein